jgi:hypothetical protein
MRTGRNTDRDADAAAQLSDEGANFGGDGNGDDSPDIGADRYSHGYTTNYHSNRNHFSIGYGDDGRPTTVTHSHPDDTTYTTYADFITTSYQCVCGATCKVTVYGSRRSAVVD